MQIIGYNTDTDNEHLRKNLLNATTFSGSPRGEITVENPTILIEGNITGLNYFKIPDFNNRYYYVTGRNVIRDNLTEVSLHVDVLMSFVDDIEQLPIFSNRNSKRPDESNPNSQGFNYDIMDPSLPCVQYTRSRVIKIASMPVKDIFYVVTVG